MGFDRDEVMQKVEQLMVLYAAGKLGGEVMPEDVNPHLEKSSALNYAYFTLPMALNYQRNSYALWRSALKSYTDLATRDIFSPFLVEAMDIVFLRQLLTRYQVALQPNRQPIIWKTICTSFSHLFDGDIRNLFIYCENSASKTKQFLLQRKKQFPYLSGAKISNYWLYTLQSYTDLTFTDRECISVAPDTHVIQASVRLGLISLEQSTKADAPLVVANSWESLLHNTIYQPIDVHTPLWLWSRGKFSVNL